MERIVGVGLACLMLAACSDRVLGAGGTDSGDATGETTDATTTEGTATGGECVPGDTMMDGCSQCVCTDDGIWACPAGLTCLAPNKDVDVLFVVDNSGSMGEEQGTLSANFGAFINVLESQDVAANYRIGITTTDNGNPWCSGTSPEGGALRATPCTQRLQEFIFEGTDPPTNAQTACTDFCTLQDLALTPTVTEQDPTPRARPWIENIEGVTNLPDGVNTLDAFQCLGPQGINGCGFESHLESMYKALRRSEDPNESSAGFVRSAARLAIIVVTDELDCSHQNKWAEIFLADGNRVFWSDPNAAFPTSAVCWNAGVSCTGGPGTYDDCVSENKNVNGDSGVSADDAVLFALGRYRDLLQDVENGKKSLNPENELLLSVIAGVPEGYPDDPIVYQDTADVTFQANFGIGPGCSSAAGEAVPPVRMRELAETFSVGGEANLFSICSSDYSPALDAIAQAIADQIKPACFTQCVADTDPGTTVLDPSCTVTQTVPAGQPENVPPCNDNGNKWELPGADINVCYGFRLDADGTSTPTPSDDMSDECVDEGWNLEFVLVRRPGFPAPAGAVVSADCELSDQPAVDCPDL